MSLEQLSQLDWNGLVKAGTLVVTLTLGYAHIDSRISANEKHKADKVQVEVMANDIKHIKESVDRIERKIDE